MAWNLISNAVKFTPVGGRVEIRSWQHASQVMIAVSDTKGVDRGATFIVRLPFSQGETAGAGDPAPTSTQDSVEFICTLLAEHDASVCTAASGAEALEKIAHDGPHVLLSDIGMPEMDGYQRISDVRELRTRARPPSGRAGAVASALL